MKPPEKIYLQACGDCNDNDYKNCKFEDLEDNVTWCKDKIFEKDIEYTRTDAFIEKASEWLCNNYDKYIRVIGSSIYPAYSDLCRDFQNYMKGE